MFKGVALSILASVTFGVLYFYSKLLGDFDSQQTFGWRIIATLPFLTAFMLWSGDFAHVKTIFQRLVKQPLLILLLMITSALTCFQLWLFLWGPMNGRGLQVSLGYFLLPLVLVLAGSLIYKEKLSKFQMLAVAFAILGVGHELWRLGSIAWETVSVAVGYALYFLIRKQIKTDNLGGFWWDILICIPVAIYFAHSGLNAYGKFVDSPTLIIVVLGLGLLSAIGLGSYILASRFLPMVLFGLLSYLEPVLLALVSLALGEVIQADEWLTYIPIWCAVAILALEGALHIYKQRKNTEHLKYNVEKLPERLND
ncbi:MULTISPECIES: EamA family transporter RarD [Acinetobacter]|uniref:EamA family transporter RarD n=1 Tax=Acinetobacter wuhouensis TaxID=1879050 RepID=A0A4Q7ADI3_9GAMM|nr:MULTISPECIES: EamA family transporter RarD [Acinetobacter]RZG44416.1 EamA family transporter RarD [Acinetobacter wuhouensis]RZG74020.1 EamA family transporter RarD [Acinetobacter wuhouensis]RZG75729.1 EamA family transporter RarD [Acinetobacter sp. WCHAc060025]